MDEPALQRIRGNRASIIFQEPMASLNPLMRVGAQVEEGRDGLGAALVLDAAAVRSLLAAPERRVVLVSGRVQRYASN